MIRFPNVEVLNTELNQGTRKRFEGEYGIEFATLGREEQEEFTAIVERLCFQSQKPESLIKNLGIVPTKKAVLYLPEPLMFLSKELTKSQAKSINEHETSKVAEYSVDIQSKIEKVDIEETFEKMTYLPDLFDEFGVPVSFSRVPFHPACGEWGGKERQFWVRESVGRRLVGFGSLLEGIGIKLHIEDAFRPVGVQEGLFRRRAQWTKRDHPEWDMEAVLLEAQSKTAVKPRLASHKAGAAVDATMINTQNSGALNIGHQYPDGGALVFPRTPFLTYEQWRNRQIFQVAAGLSDLTMYVGEDWHVSYGDNLASLDENGNIRENYRATYGPIKSFDHLTGEITSVYSSEEMDRTFDL